MIFFLKFPLNFSDLLIQVLAEKFLTSFCVCIKKLFGAKNREGVVIVNTVPGLFGQYSFFLSKIIQVGGGMVGKDTEKVSPISCG
jgi:hypothetical protein